VVSASPRHEIVTVRERQIGDCADVFELDNRFEGCIARLAYIELFTGF
jgi:hypothetical protein